MAHVDLLELPYFEGISIDELVSLVDLMEPRQFAPGAELMHEGDPTPPPLFIATAGRVLICKRVGATERNLAEFESPTLFGEIELFCQIPPVSTVRALTPMSCFALTRETFSRLFGAHNAALMCFVFNVARVACHRLAIADEMMARLLTGEDLVKMRRAVFAAMSADRDWPEKTGFFRRQSLTRKT
jgi:CRP-like cAMP-binding protein